MTTEVVQGDWHPRLSQVSTCNCRKKQNESENDELMAKKRFSLPSKADHEEESHRWRALWLAEASFDCKLIEPKGRKVLVGRDFVARLQHVSART